MTPYYQDDAVTIYHGDCREVIPHVVADVLVADPPYGVNLDTSSRNAWLPDHLPVAGDAAPFDPAHLLALGLPTVLFGANHYASRLPDSRGWICWDKATRDGLELKQAEVEFGWTNFLSRPRMLRHMWSGAYRASERGERYHPTQKPVVLLRWVLDWTPPGTVLDPYMGSGPTLRAAKDVGRKAIGIEIEERYCEVAAKRCAQEVLFGEVA
jgi:site-specific DNA-methyltransferase (adenine-specific)